jgi:hypothetical protein
MSALVTDQFRILNASNFIDSVQDSTNSYYVFVGLSNPGPVSGSSPAAYGFGRDSNWNTTPPNPTDNIDYLNHYESTALFGKKITSANIRRVIRKIDWVEGTKYEMYRPDYSVVNPSPITGAMRLYDANYYVINSDYRVYICIDNGSSGINTTGNSSQDQPTFTDLEPSRAGESGDGYIWKYLYTVSPSDIIKFDSIEYITVPNDWQTTTDSQINAVRENGDSTLNDNQLKKVYIQNRGLGYTLTSGKTCNIIGDGSGATVSLDVDTSGRITDATVTSGGKNYTYALVDLGTTGNPGIYAQLIPIIPPSKGHGFDVYRELGADKVLIYARFDDSTKDFPVDTKFSQVGILKNPTVYDSTGINTSKFTSSEFSAVYAMKFGGTPTGSISVGDKIQQSVTGGTAVGYVASYDSETKVLKYYQDRSLYFNPTTYNQTDYVGLSTSGKVLQFNSSNQVSKVGGGFNASVDSSFIGITTTISNKIINLGVQFTNGLANPEINNKSGDIIYIDNRPIVTRSSRQKEDVKIILEF